MTRIYRTTDTTGTHYVVQNEGGWQALEGDLFGDWSAGAAVAVAGTAALVRRARKKRR